MPLSLRACLVLMAVVTTAGCGARQDHGEAAASDGGTDGAPASNSDRDANVSPLEGGGLDARQETSMTDAESMADAPDSTLNQAISTLVSGSRLRASYLAADGRASRPQAFWDSLRNEACNYENDSTTAQSAACPKVRC